MTIALEDGPHEARLRDVSRAGGCFFLERRVPEMTILKLELDLPEQEAPDGAEAVHIEGSGVVVRCQPIGPHVEHFEVAVFLNDMSESNREALEAYVRELATGVLDSGVEKGLEPMNAADRKVVHDTVNEIDGVGTISVGDEPRRRVVLVKSDS